MYNKESYFYGTGRRKSSVARVRLYLLFLLDLVVDEQLVLMFPNQNNHQYLYR